MGLMAAAVSAQAQLAFNLAWNSNPEPDIVSYRVYVGTASRQYPQSFPTVVPSLAIPNLPVGPTYYFSVTAVNSAGLESDFSAEISSSGVPSGPVVNSTLTASSIRLTANATPGSTVIFESSTNLQDWTFQANRTANTQGIAAFNVSRTATQPHRFFRIQTQ
jgi:fibronectin type 3 domain-containing protein